MDSRILKCLVDINIAIHEINTFFELKQKSFENYRNDILLKRAIERELEIIGEAMNRIIKNDESYLNIIGEARSIVALRNHIIHAYDHISDENIWSILIEHLPKLEKDIIQLIDQQ